MTTRSMTETKTETTLAVKSYDTGNVFSEIEGIDPVPGLCVRRRANSALERPVANVIDLLFHRARERNDLHSDADEILLRDLRVRQPGLGQSRDYALLDFGAGPTNRELHQLR